MAECFRLETPDLVARATRRAYGTGVLISSSARFRRRLRWLAAVWVICPGWALAADGVERASEPGTPQEADTAPDLDPVAPVEPSAPKPPPMHAEYIQYGAALTAEINVISGASCPELSPSGRRMPCILGSGGGPAIRIGYRSPGPWYIGGVYEFVKMDSSNLYRLGIFQQVRAEMRYLTDTSYRASPYISWGIGAVGYGSEWGIETGGGILSVGGGVEIEASRLAVVGVGLSYRPALIAGWTDTAGFTRPTGVAHFIALDLILEARGELGRR